jgi:ELWxxDGT repeat protein
VGTTANGNLLLEVGDYPARDDVQLLTTDGTASGTSLLHDFRGFTLSNLGTAAQNGNPNLTALNGNPFLEVVNQATNDVQLWMSDGTASGTLLLQDFGYIFNAGVDFRVLGTGGNGNVLIEVVYDPAHPDSQLWATDGTAPGTSLLHDFANVQLSSVGTTGNGNMLIKSQSNDTNDVQLWGSNGTASGTSLLQDFGREFWSQSNFALIDLGTAGNGIAIIEAMNQVTNDLQLWGSNGTASGTSLLHDFGTSSRVSFDQLLGTTGTGID